MKTKSNPSANKRSGLTALTALIIFAAGLFIAANARAFSATDADTIFNDYNNALYIASSGNG